MQGYFLPDDSKHGLHRSITKNLKGKYDEINYQLGKKEGIAIICYTYGLVRSNFKNDNRVGELICEKYNGIKCTYYNALFDDSDDISPPRYVY